MIDLALAQSSSSCRCDTHAVNHYSGSTMTSVGVCFQNFVEPYACPTCPIQFPQLEIRFKRILELCEVDTGCGAYPLCSFPRNDSLWLDLSRSEIEITLEGDWPTNVQVASPYRRSVKYQTLGSTMILSNLSQDFPSLLFDHECPLQGISSVRQVKRHILHLSSGD